ncbi:MAG: type VI immunity family protein [Pseudomonadota bacterium]
MDEKNEYQNLNEIPIPSQKTGKTIMHYAGKGQLYLIATDHSRSSEMCDMAEAFLSVFDRTVTQFRKANGREIRIQAGNWRTYFENRDPQQDDYGSFFIDLFAAGKIPPIRLEMFTPFDLSDPDLASTFGRCSFHFPLPWLKKNRAEFISHLQQWCSILKPEQGSFGIGLVCAPGMERNRTRDAWPYLSRFSGLDHPTMMDWSAPNYHAGIRAVNWLTVLDNTWIDRLGGMDEIAEGLHEEGRLHPYDGGVVIQACTHPQLGDINMHGVPEAYAAVDKLIAPHRYLDYPDKPMHLLKVPDPLDPHETTLEWLQRFEPDED